MTATADAKRRIYLKAVKPGDRFDVQESSKGIFVLRRLEPVGKGKAAKIRFEKRGRFTVGVLDRPVDMEAVKELLADFP